MGNWSRLGWDKESCNNEVDDNTKLSINNYQIRILILDVRETLRHTILNHYKPGIDYELNLDHKNVDQDRQSTFGDDNVRRSTFGDTCLEIGLKGTAWSGKSVYGLQARSMLIEVLKAASSKGWNMDASADVSATFDKNVNIKKIVKHVNALVQ
jgi:hypothetical protein